MGNLSKETIKRIKADALRFGVEEHGWDEESKDYLAGALHEAERAAGLVDMLETIKENYPGSNAGILASAALAKYREVGNG